MQSNDHDLDAVDCADKEALRKAVESKVWFHSIDLGGGIVTRGQKTAAALEMELGALRLPDMQDKTVLDIGAYDGFYSFEAERRGASRVLSLDQPAWEVETAFTDAFLKECAANSVTPSPPYRTECLRWELRPEELPGKKKFDLVHRALNSHVESMVRDFGNTGPEHIGMFDIVLFMGVLYHLQDPLGAMRRVASLTREAAVIETEAMEIAGHGQRALCEFFPADELNGDYSNWWSPNMKALIGLCTAAGFSRVEIVQGPPAPSRSSNDDVVRYRAIVHAWK